ncbi:hypothetical protein KAF25_004312 [Fusarium avenaceum]|uniref:Uncharacterized protein n=1 Tax=Fusarium avenaceum TaxID=40199 RepID=A0A9P7H906_9HYPO|nr:hypothetical protein KAF25_004312 [Fusarium avenaceum]
MAPVGSDIALATSPYFGATCNVIFQDEATATVHCNVVPAGLRSSARYCQAEWCKLVILDMKDIESDTGHVIVHFWYSGRYQSLKSSNLSDANELRLSIKVHAASLSLKLETLQALTEDKILKLSDQLSFPLVLDVVGKSEINFAKFPRYAEYLQSHLISLKMDSLDQIATDILLKLETPDTFSMVLLKTLVVLGRKAASNQPNVGREYSETELSHTQSLAKHASEIVKENGEIETPQTKEKQALQMIKVHHETMMLRDKEIKRGGRLLKKDRQRLALLEEQIVAYNLEHNQKSMEDKSEPLEEEDEQSTNQPVHINEDAKVEQDTATKEAAPCWAWDSPGKKS